MTSQTRARGAIAPLRLVRPTSTEAGAELECVRALKFTGLRKGQRDDPVPSAWRDLLALLWAGASRGAEMVEIVHEFERSEDGRPLQYGQWLRLWQLPSARPSVSRSSLAEAARGALPALNFEECRPEELDASGWLAHAHLSPARVRAVTPGRSGGATVQGEWSYPGTLPNWKLTVPIDEPLARHVRLHCRFVAAELSMAERDEAAMLLRFIASGHAKVLFPGADYAAEHHHAQLTATLEERLRAWVVECVRGFRFDVIVATPVDQGLSAYALRRVAHDVFGSFPVRVQLLDEAEFAPPAPALPVSFDQGLPGCFISPSRLREVFSVPELSDPPRNLPKGPGVVIGDVGGCRVCLPYADAASHMLVVGGSGTGKTSLVSRIIQQDLKQGVGVVVLDPHGGLADQVSRDAEALGREVILIDVDDPGCGAAINPMEGTQNDPAARAFVADQLVHMIKNNGETTHTWGPAAENHLRNLFLLAMCHPSGGTIADAARSLEDDDFCQWLLSKTKDSSLIAHFKHWRIAGDNQGIASWRPWLIARLHPFTKSMPMLRMLSRPSTVDVAKAIEASSVLVFGLSKDTLSELECQLLGTTLLMEFHRAALARARLPADRRPFCRLVVDEFQTFVSDATPVMFREVRKYNLGLLCATQSLGSLKSRTSEHLLDAVLANTATKAILRVSPADANLLDDYTLPEFTRADLMRTPNYEAFMCMSSGGNVPPIRVRLSPPDELIPTGDAPRSPSQDELVARHELARTVDEFLAQRHGVTIPR